jgi:hypothetical protein
MNAVQKATFAATALAITLVGAVLVTAPMALARPVPVMAHTDCSTQSLQLTLSGHVTCSSAELIAFNRR